MSNFGTLAGGAARRTLALAGVLLLGAGCGAAASTIESPSTAVSQSALQSESGGLRSTKPSESAETGIGERGEPRERMIIKVGNLTVLTKEPRAAFDRAIEIARELGGYTLSSSHTDSRSSVTVRVPASRFEEALGKLGALGKVSRREITGTDATSEYLDLSIRLQNAEKTRLRYLDLLAKAQSVPETLQVERELERITTLVEQLRGQTNLIKNQVSLSTVNLAFETPTRPGPIGWIFYGLFHAVKWLFVW
jgi:hypothetical protein